MNCIYDCDFILTGTLWWNGHLKDHILSDSIDKAISRLRNIFHINWVLPPGIVHTNAWQDIVNIDEYWNFGKFSFLLTTTWQISTSFDESFVTQWLITGLQLYFSLKEFHGRTAALGVYIIKRQSHALPILLQYTNFMAEIDVSVQILYTG